MLDNEKIILSCGFKLLSVSESELLKEYVSKSDEPLSSCTNFPSILGWSNATVPYYKLAGGAFCLIFNDSVYNTWLCYPPICNYAENPPDEALLFLSEVFEAMGLPMRMYYAKEWMLPYFEANKDFTIEKKCDDALSDYIYSRDGFNAYLNRADIRYVIRYFQRKFDPKVEWLTEENMHEYIEFLKDIWCSTNSCEDCIYGCMCEALTNMLQTADRSGLESFLVRSGGKCVAYCGYTVCNNELVVLIKKVTKSMKGITDYVHKEMMNSVGQNITRINYTEDMGIEGLRKYKQKLAVYTLSGNYELTIRRREK